MTQATGEAESSPAFYFRKNIVYFVFACYYIFVINIAKIFESCRIYAKMPL